MHTEDLSKHVIRGDFIGHVLLESFGLIPATLSLIGVAYASFMHLLVGNIIGVTLFPLRGPTPPAWYEAIQEFALVPLIWYFYAWMPQGINTTLNSLWSNSVFTSDTSYQDFVIEFKRIFRLLALSPWLALIILIPVFITEGSYWETWSIARNPNSWIYLALYGIYMGFSWYFIIQMACREILLSVELLRLFQKRKVRVNLWHPDKKGGLGVLSEYKLKIALILAIVAVILVIVSFPSHLKAPAPSRNIPTLFTIYLILGPTVFFLPLLGAHYAMKDAKNKLLNDVSKGLNQYLKVDFLTTDKNWEYKFEHVIRIRALIEEYPVWPFDLAVIGRFVFVTLFPAALNILSFFLLR